MNARELLGRAAASFRNRDLEAAETHCRTLLAREPHNAAALHLLALIARQARNPAAAEACFRASIAADPADSEVRSNFANLLRSSGRFAEAVEQLRAALRIDAGFDAARLTLARVLLDSNAPAEAEAIARELTERNAADAAGWATLALAQQRQGKPAEAESSFRSAIRLRPDYAIARHNLGALLCQQHRPEDALLELERAERLGAASPELHYNRGSALFELGRLDEAEAALLRSLELRPEAEKAHVLLAKLRYMRGDEDYARELSAAVASSPDPALHLALGDLLRRGGRLAEAESAVRAIAERHPGVPEIESSLAVVLQETGRLSEAAEHARRAWQQRPDSAAFVENLVAILLQCGETEEAWPLITQQRALRPLDQRWLAYLATAARLSGRAHYRELYDYARFVRSYDLEPPAGFDSIGAFNRRLADYLDRWHAFATHPLDQSLRHGTQTARDLLSDPEPVVKAFFEAIAEPLAAYCDEIGFEARHDFLVRNTGNTRVVAGWSVRLGRGGYHVNHIHPQGWISSAYYVDVPPEVTDKHRRSGWIKFGEPRQPTPGLDAEHFVQPEPGKLVLFPSYMWHGTTAIEEDRPRLTIAFDAIPEPP